MPRVPLHQLAFSLCAVFAIMWPTSSPAQTPEQINACAANKTDASGAYMDAVIDCQTRVARQGDGADAKCVLQAARKMTQAFAAIERGGGCATANDAPTVIARINASVTDLVAMLDPANSTQCRKQQLKAMGKEAERQARCVADAVALGSGQSIDVACQGDASERFLTEFARANGCSVLTDAEAIDAAIRTAASLARNIIKLPVTACAPIEITALHGTSIQGNSRLSQIDNGHVACLHTEDGALASCLFSTVSGRQSGEWLESPSGNHALVGQAIRLDGTPGGDYVIAASLSAGALAACVEPTSMDTMGRVAEGTQLANICVIEDLLTEYNALNVDYGWAPLSNYADREVCMANNPATHPHPDLARLTRSYSSTGSGPDDTFCYSEMGAALNDINGAERDWLGQYFAGDGWCHYIVASGYEVPAAKRPATFSLPAPGGIDTKSFLKWRPVSTNFVIANGAESASVQTFDNANDFVNATGASTASGPLPNIGQVTSRTTIGSLTFSLASGGNTMSIGALGTPAEPDWYPLLAGPEIALGYESLQVQTLSPVYSLGFEFVEPNVSMPPFGGTPGDSTFEIVLYSGATEVARTTFNALDDVVTFVGVWSDRPFDRVTIIDLSGNDDDEYFGQFYIGKYPIP